MKAYGAWKSSAHRRRIPCARLGRKDGLQHFFTQYGPPTWSLEYCLEYVCSFFLYGCYVNPIAAINADLVPVTDKVPFFVHHNGFYLDQEVRPNTKAFYRGRPSNEVVQKMVRLAA